MSLSLYRKKRKFNSTSEPAGGKASGSGLRFVVQKHDASHLHYDFRLEMEGVLKSWAVPKGPSLNPEHKRLAMKVEDHPLDYRSFEGVIPEGNYGAGTVIVWDEGTYTPVGGEDLDKKQQEKMLLEELKKKKLKISLRGKKLKGEFALFKTGFGAANAWLLAKLDDEYASGNDITEKDKSVISKRNLAQVAKAGGIAASEKTASAKTTPVRKRAVKKKIAAKKAPLKKAPVKKARVVKKAPTKTKKAKP